MRVIDSCRLVFILYCFESLRAENASYSNTTTVDTRGFSNSTNVVNYTTTISWDNPGEYSPSCTYVQTEYSLKRKTNDYTTCVLKPEITNDNDLNRLICTHLDDNDTLGFALYVKLDNSTNGSKASFRLAAHSATTEGPTTEISGMGSGMGEEGNITKHIEYSILKPPPDFLINRLNQAQSVFRCLKHSLTPIRPIDQKALLASVISIAVVACIAVACFTAWAVYQRKRQNASSVFDIETKASHMTKLEVDQTGKQLEPEGNDNPALEYTSMSEFSSPSPPCEEPEVESAANDEVFSNAIIPFEEEIENVDVKFEVQDTRL